MFAVPCGYQYTAFDGTLQGANNTDCNWDKAALSDYLGSTNLINLFVNQVELDVRDFSDSKFKKHTSV